MPGGETGALAECPDSAALGDEIYALAAELYPICRSITGDGVRRTLQILGRAIDLQISEVPTGTPVFDWTVPREWTIRDAYIKNESGERVVDFREHSLHVLNYSAPVRERLPLADLKPHIHTLPDQPDLIPYRTSYYAERWGFCMAHNRLAALPDGEYEAVIDASLTDGYLTYGEYLHRGETEDEFLLSAHICHPSLANDNCSGLALLTLLAKSMAGLRTRLSYRFIFAPGTIGAITWLARNEANVGRIKHGLTVSCVGDGGGPTYKKSRRGDAMIDRAMLHVLKHAAPSPDIIDFFPYGYDERQYCSPGFNLAGRDVRAQPVRDIPRISYLSGQSRFHPPRASGRVLPHDHGGNRHRRKRPPLRQSVAEMRTATRPERALRSDRRRQGRRGQEHGDALGAQSVGWGIFAARYRRARRAALRRSSHGTAKLLEEHGLLAPAETPLSS